jgi:phosphatidylglycerophosphate synthase
MRGLIVDVFASIMCGMIDFDYREAADVVSYAKAMGNGGVVGSLITAPPEDEYSWGRAITYSVVSLGDALDGWIARKDPRGTNEKGAMLDQNLDKITSYASESAIALKHSDPVAGASVLLDIVRDRLVNRKRHQIIQLNQDLKAAGRPIIEVKARKLGKAKTVGKSVTNAIALSPIGERHPNIVRAMRVGCMALTVVSGVDFITKANQAIETTDVTVID